LDAAEAALTADCTRYQHVILSKNAARTHLGSD
jgi:hypothetical protein